MKLETIDSLTPFGERELLELLSPQMGVLAQYVPHAKQAEVHASSSRFRVVAAGRRSGKTTLAINELISEAKSYPLKKTSPSTGERSWFICETYKQAEMVGWQTLLRYLPPRFIKNKRGRPVLSVELTNGHLIEFKGALKSDSLRGVALRFVVLDEYGLMAPAVWTEIIRPMLTDTQGRALFIGTPGATGSPHFHEMYNRGKMGEPGFTSWLFHTTDNTCNPEIVSEVAKAKLELPSDIFHREYEADFDSTAGIIYDNFKHATHVIPNYEPQPGDFIVGSIDPGIFNATAAILCAWDQKGCGRIFWEYYEKEKISSENAKAIHEATRKYRVGYWTIDRASKHRDQSNGITVYDKYQELLRPLVPAYNEAHSVLAGIDEVKKLFHIDPQTNRPRLQVTALCKEWLSEISRYIKYKRRWHADRNEEEKPRKLNDHLMDCTRNMVYSKPWIRPSIRIFEPTRTGYPI